MHEKLLDQPVLYLSKYIIVHKDDYYYNLGLVTQRSAWKPWILCMLDAVEKTSHLTNQLISNMLNQMDSTIEHAKTRIKWYIKRSVLLLTSPQENKIIILSL